MKPFIKKCINCGEEFDATEQPRQTACSDECREVLVRMNRTSPDGTALPRGQRRCIKCGTIFSQGTHHTNDPRHCSYECQLSYHLKCRYCGRDFLGDPSSEFCSSDCRSYWLFDQRWEKEQARMKSCACPACNETFIGPGQFCSEYCRASTIELQRIMRGGWDHE